MTISKNLGLGVALAALGSLIPVACTSGSCTAACEHVVSCGTFMDAGTYCQDTCGTNTGYGLVYSTCKNPAAGFDCLAGLSCQDVIETDGPSSALLGCKAKAECPDAG